MIHFGKYIIILSIIVSILVRVACFGFLVYGIYAIFAKSVIEGLVLIGASFVVHFIEPPTSNAISAIGRSIVERSLARRKL